MEIKSLDGNSSMYVPDEGISIPAQRTVAQTLAATADLNPDDEAESERLAKKLGVSPDMVRSDLPFARKMATPDGIAEIHQKAPVTAAMLTDSRIMSQASDDIGALASFEDTFKSIGNVVKGGFGAQFPSQLGEKAMAFIGNLVPEDSSFWVAEGHRAPSPIPVAKDFFKTSSDFYAIKPEDHAKTLLGKVIEGVGSAPGQITAYALPTLLSGGALGPVPVMAGIGALDAGVSADGKLDIAKAAEGGAKGAVTGVALEVANYLPKIASVPALGAMFTAVTALEGGSLSDSVASGLTMSVLGLLGHNNPSWREDLVGIKMKEITPDTATRLDAVTKEVNAVIDANPDHARDAMDRGVFPQYLQDILDGKVEAKAKQDSIKALFDAAKQSKLVERNPDMAAEILGAVAKDNGAPVAYLQADEVYDKLVNQKGMTPDEAVKWVEQYGVDKNDFVTALDTGGKLALDAGKALAGAKADPIMDEFIPDLHTDPADTPLSKAEESKVADMVAKNNMSEKNAKSALKTIDPEKANEIIHSLKTQLGESYNKNVVDSMILPLIAKANTWAERTGGDALDNLKRMGISVVRTTRAKFEEKYGKIGPAAGDVKTGRPKSDAPKSFVSVLRKAGGIDPAKALGMEGEIAGWSDRQSGTSGLVRKGGLSMDGVLDLAAEYLGKEPGEITFADVSNLIDSHLRGEKGGKFKVKADAYEGRFDPAGPMFQSFPEGDVRNTGKVNEVVDMSGKTYASELEYWQNIADKQATGTPDPAGFSAVDENGNLFQSGKNLVRGAIVPGDANNIIHLFESRNLSTFLHEVGHLFLNDLKDMALKDGVMAEEWQAVKDWLGAKGDTITVKQHEKFARGFERYLMEGKAPSAPLRNAFATFKRWLTNIYSDVRNLKSDITPEIRMVFDKMLATDEQIARERAVQAGDAKFTPEAMEKAGMTKKAVKEYAESIQTKYDRASETLDALKLSGDVKGLNKLRKGWSDQANVEAMKTRFFNAAEFVMRGTEGKSGETLGGRGIDKADFIERFGDKVAKEMPRGIFKDGGIPFELAMEDANAHLASKGLGEYGTTAEFVKDLTSMPTKGEWIKMRVNELEVAHEATPDIKEAIRNSAYRKQLEIESEYLGRMAKQAATDQKQSVFERASYEALREYARRTVAGQKMDKMPSIYNLHVQSDILQRKIGMESYKGNWGKAFELQEQLRANEAIISERNRVKADYKAKQDAWKRMAKSDVAYDYRQQLNQFMRKWEMTKANLQVDDGIKPLRYFLESLQDDEGYDLNIADAFENFTMADASAPINTLTWQQVQDIHDVARFLEKKGYEIKNGILSDKKTRVEDAAASIAAQLNDVKPVNKTADNKVWRKVQDATRTFLAKHDTLMYLTQAIDGYLHLPGKAIQGILERDFFNKIMHGEAMKTLEMQEVAKRLKVHQDQIVKTLKEYKGKKFAHVDVPEIMRNDGRVWTIDKIFAAALNMGNRENLERLMKGYDMSASDVKKLTSVLKAEDWDAVQGVWNEIHSLYPKTDEVHLRTRYFRMKKIQADAFTVALADGSTKDIAGGYYPAVYDGKLSGKVAGWDEKSDLLNSAEAIFQIPSAKSQFTKSRAEGAPSMPLKLDLGVIYQHLNAVTSYIHLSEAVTDFDRVTQNSGLTAKIKEVIGAEKYNMIKPALKNMLRPEIAPDLRMFLHYTKSLGTMAALTYRTMTAVKQIDGAFPMAAEVGKANYMKAMAKVMAHPMDSFNTVMDASHYMKERLGHIDVDIARRMADFKPQRTLFGKTIKEYRDFGYIPIQVIDTITTIPGWIAAYENALTSSGGDIGHAITMADKAVSKTQGGSSMLERSNVTNSKGVYSLFNYFMSNAITMGSRRRYMADARRAGKVSNAGYAANAVWEVMVPVILTGMMKAYLEDGKPEDAKNIASDILTAPLRYTVVVRDLANSLSRVIVDDQPAWRAAMTVPSLKIFQLGIGTTDEAKKYIETGDWEPLAWDIFNEASYYSGFPAARTLRDFQKGYAQYQNGGQFTNILAPSKEKK